MNHERISAGAVTLTVEADTWTRVDLPVGLPQGVDTTITAYATLNDVSQPGDVIGISAIVLHPDARHSAWSAGSFIYPRP